MTNQKNARSDRNGAPVNSSKKAGLLMFVRHSLLNTVRVWNRTIPFFLILVLLVLILGIGLSLTATLSAFLAKCEEDYTTIAVFEYIGPDYPDDTVFDASREEAAAQLAALGCQENEMVEVWDGEAKALGYAEGSALIDQSSSTKECAVLVVRMFSYKESDDVYYGRIADSLYSFSDHDGEMLYIHSPAVELKAGRYYLISGSYYSGRSSYTYFRVEPLDNAAALMSGVDGSMESMVVDVTSEKNYYELPEGLFDSIAATRAVTNTRLIVNASDDIEALYPFQQEILHIEKGRAPTGEEYESGARVCIVSRSFAEGMGLSTGDSTKLSFAFGGGLPINDCYWADNGFAKTESFEIIGIFADQLRWNNNIYLPKRSLPEAADSCYSCTLAQAKLRNSSAESFREQYAPILPEHVRMTIYDQGYSDVSGSFGNILRTATMITVICALAVLIFIALYGFLTVYKQRAIARTMLQLGAGKSGVFTYFLFGSGVVAFFAAIIGSVAGYFGSGLMCRVINGVVSGGSAGDMLYSNSSLSVKKPISPLPPVGFDMFVLFAVIVFVLALLSCYAFTLAAIAKKRSRRSSLRRKSVRVSRSLKGGALKYSILSVSRGGLRAVAPILVIAAAALLFCQLTTSTQVIRGRLEQVRSSSSISGSFTDSSGRQMSGLSIKAAHIKRAMASGCIDSISVAFSRHYLFAGITRSNGVDIEPEELEIPNTSSFSYETFIDKVIAGPSVIYTNDFASAPEFFYTSKIEAEFWDGYDTSIFSAEYDKKLACCILSTEMMEAESIALGDKIRVFLVVDGSGSQTLYDDMLVVGSFRKSGRMDNIYCQLGRIISPAQLFDPELLMPYAPSFTSALFELTSSSQLPEFKQYMWQSGFSPVNVPRSDRSYIVIDDSSFLATESSLSQRLWYMERIFPVLYVLTELLALVAAFMLIQIRKREFAAMRGMGARVSTAFMSFFIEQVLLCIFGAAIGLLYCFASGSAGVAGITLFGLFILFWLLGSAIAAIKTNRASVISILRED